MAGARGNARAAFGLRGIPTPASRVRRVGAQVPCAARRFLRQASPSRGKARGKTAPVRRNERRIRGTESVLGRIRRLRSPAGARAEQRVSGIDRELYRARARVSCAARAKQGRSPGVLRRGTRARETGEG